jgi:type II secretory ATPase GspE/PulE/Tfp pilus assembly ATPase PilB-like protein
MGLPKESFLSFLQKHFSITNDMKEVLLIEEQQSKRPIEFLALDTGLISEEGLIDFFAQQRNCQIAQLSDHHSDIKDLIKRFPFKDLEENVAIPFKVNLDEKVITFAMFDLGNIKSKEHIESLLPPGHTMDVEIAKKSEILSILALHAPAANPESKIQYTIDDKMVGKFLYDIFSTSIQNKASDIHFEPASFFVRVRIRCDGVLKTLKCFHKSLWQEVSIQIKVLSGMDIAESRLPQDGRFDLPVLGQNIDFRVSSHPTHHGESIVLRALKKHAALIPIKELGYSAYALGRIQKIIERPEGLTIVTGPTGSGKTTSLYSILSSFNMYENNIMTLEEPIEYKISGIRQSEITHDFDFYTGIHSALRQDPDIILIGEIRDEKVARTTIRASMTGHKVLSTLHTIRAIDAIERLVELKIPLHMIINILNGIINQRLVRTLCQNCMRSDQPSAQEIKTFHLHHKQTINRATGCERCFFSGYSGRKIIAEVIFLDADLASLILQKPAYSDIYRMLFDKGFQTLENEICLMVQSLETSAEEAFRILGNQ